jgi:RNA polymerase sigma factor (sigma-70 family)
MPLGRWEQLFRHMSKLAAPGPAGAPTDRQLLERFAARRDEAAFAVLVERHGTLVLGACRRILGDTADADDAFQATFLVLARKAGTGRWHDALGPWLHAVAWRVARKARADLLRRRLREEEVCDLPTSSPSEDVMWRDLRPVLDEEVLRLPAKYRAPIVLCYLEGRSNAEAAQQLGWPIGTVKGRLAQGRDLLHAQLTRRGLALSATALGTLPAAETAQASSSQVQATTSAALAFVTKPATARATAAAALAEGALHTMTLTKLKTVFVILLAVLVVGIGFVLAVRAAWQPSASAEPAEGPASSPAAKPGPGAPRLRAKWRSVRLPQGGQALAFTPDGQVLASAVPLGMIDLWQAPAGKKLRQLMGHRPEQPPEVLARMKGNPPRTSTLVFSADGKTLASGGNDKTVRLWEVATGKNKESWPCPIEPAALVFGLDGKLWAAGQTVQGKTNALMLWEVGTDERQRLPGKVVGPGSLCFSPDGRFLVWGEVVFHKGALVDKNRLHLWDVRAGKEVRVWEGNQVKRSSIHAASFSADGKLLLSAGQFDRSAHIWEVATGKEICSWIEDAKGVETAVLSPDGTRAACVRQSDLSVRCRDIGTGKEFRLGDADRAPAKLGQSVSLVFTPDGEALALGDEAWGKWAEVQAVRGNDAGAPAAALALEPRELEALWSDLGGEDAAAAYRAIARLRAAHRQAVSMLTARLRPARGSVRARQLIVDLGDNQFAVRQKAAAELEKLGESARAALEGALAGQPTLDVRQRVKQLLERLAPLTPEQVRELRAVRTLELIGTREARTLLKALAEGETGARLTEDARAALSRLGS